MFSITSAYVNKLFLFWRKSVRNNPNLTVMEFAQAEEIIKIEFIKKWELISNKWELGEYSNINDFLLKFYESQITKEIIKAI